MYANTSWNGGSYGGTVGDITTRTYKNWSHAGSWSSADTGEAIVERPTYSGRLRDLSNFGTMTFSTAVENSTYMNGFSPAGGRTALRMYDTGGTLMAEPSDPGALGTFTDGQYSCS